MILFGNLLIGLGQILSMVLNLVLIVVIVSCVLSWFRVNPYHPVVNSINSLAEALYRWPRRYFRTSFAQMDFAPMILVVGIYFLITVLVGSLVDYGNYLRIVGQYGSEGAVKMELQQLPKASKGPSL
jgi:YggT family protein